MRAASFRATAGSWTASTPCSSTCPPCIIGSTSLACAEAKPPNRKTVTAPGATGSIGRTTLEPIAACPDQFRVGGLAARGSDVALVAQQVRAHRPRAVALLDRSAVDRLARELSSPLPELLGGPEGLASLAAEVPADVVVSALVGSAGLVPTLAAIQAGRTIALANKEPLVMAGALMTRAAREHLVRLLPVDSEHSAIFQCLAGAAPREVRRLVLTASGGPFRGRPRESLEGVTVEQALRHPTWRMGAKITIDSATLMNKGLEVLEAHWLFGVPFERIDVVIHHQSVIHSLVEFVDGSVKAQLGLPDMRLPIQYAMAHPRRLAAPVERLDLAEVGRLTFTQVDSAKYPCLGLAYFAGRHGGTYPTVLNAANEVAVARFLSGNLAYTHIAQ